MWLVMGTLLVGGNLAVLRCDAGQFLRDWPFRIFGDRKNQAAAGLGARAWRSSRKR